MHPIVAGTDDVMSSLPAGFFDCQVIINSLAVRSEVLGRDRYLRTYMQLGGRCGQATLTLRDTDGRWSQIHGKHAVRQLFNALHVDGHREGALRLALSCSSLAFDFADADMEENETNASPGHESILAAKSSPPFVGKHALRQPQMIASFQVTESLGSSIEFMNNVVQAQSATPATTSASTSDCESLLDESAESSRRMLALALAIGTSTAAPSALHDAASTALAHSASREVAALRRPLPQCNAPQLETARLAVSWPNLKAYSINASHCAHSNPAC